MTEKVRNFWDTNWKWVIGVALMSGINIGIAQTQLLDKTDREDVIEIVRKEIPLAPIVVRMETNQKSMLESLSAIKTKLDITP